MISAPRSASTWVPKGPAPNCDTARILTFSSGARAMSVGELALAEGRVVLHGHEDLAGVRADGVAALIDADGLDRDDSPVSSAGRGQLEHGAPRVERVADEGGLLVLQLVDFE